MSVRGSEIPGEKPMYALSLDMDPNLIPVVDTREILNESVSRVALDKFTRKHVIDPSCLDCLKDVYSEDAPSTPDGSRSGDIRRATSDNRCPHAHDPDGSSMSQNFHQMTSLKSEGLKVLSLSSKENSLYKDLVRYFRGTDLIERVVLPILIPDQSTRDEVPSLRLTNHAVTAYANHYDVSYMIRLLPDTNFKEGKLSPMEWRRNRASVSRVGQALRDVPIHLADEYMRHLDFWGKPLFDPFRRHYRVPFPCFDKEKTFITTIGQLNFFRFAIRIGLFEYCTLHRPDILDHMNSRKRLKKNTKQAVRSQKINKTVKNEQK